MNCITKYIPVSTIRNTMTSVNGNATANANHKAPSMVDYLRVGKAQQCNYSNAVTKAVIRDLIKSGNYSETILKDGEDNTSSPIEQGSIFSTEWLNNHTSINTFYIVSADAGYQYKFTKYGEHWKVSLEFVEGYYTALQNRELSLSELIEFLWRFRVCLNPFNGGFYSSHDAVPTSGCNKETELNKTFRGNDFRKMQYRCESDKAVFHAFLRGLNLESYRANGDMDAFYEIQYNQTTDTYKLINMFG
jgi:hypothetical protein